MKLKYQFESLELDGKIVAVPIGDSAVALHAVLNLNNEAMQILKCLENDTTVDEITDKLTKEYDSPRDVIYNAVCGFIDKLQNEGLLV